MSSYNINKTHRLVIKIGSSTLAGAQGLNSRRISQLAASFAAAHKDGRDVVIVSSGAIAAGRGKIGLNGRPRTVCQKQACAAIGQASLMSAWEKPLARFGVKSAQILLTAEDLADRGRFLNARNTLNTLLDWRVIPIINENDTVAAAEIKVGDNDTLGALVASLVEADLFINLTDIEGLFEADPNQNPKARLISEVKQVDSKILALAGGSGGPFGTGGMYTKVRAAKRLSEHGIPSLIAPGQLPDVLGKILAGEQIGTFFHPRVQKLAGKKNWLAFAAKPKGRIIVDDGAKKALLSGGKSLLPSGVTEAQGNFEAGDPVRILSRTGEFLAIGLANYAALEINKIKGAHSHDIETILGFTNADEAVHRDNLVLAAGLI